MPDSNDKNKGQKNTRIVSDEWDYTVHAKYYEFRPNYAKVAIDMLTTLVGGGRSNMPLKVADIGAGSGNLSIMLLEAGAEVSAVEPNDAMREIGIERTRGQNITWSKATGDDSGLPGGAFDWVCFGSSFNVLDRGKALKEAHRLLKNGGYFSCMWNHRDLADSIQKEAERIITSFIPHYERGVRREDQRPFIESHKELFDSIVYLEADFYFYQSIENYINAWRSVKNPYWDLESSQGSALFERIATKFKEALPESFHIKYTTRCWSARKCA